MYALGLVYHEPTTFQNIPPVPPPLGLRQSKFCHSDNYLLFFSSFILGSQILGATCPPATRFDCVRLPNLIELNRSIEFNKVWLSNCPSGCVKKWRIFSPFNVFTKFDISAWGVDTFSAYSSKKSKNNNKNFALSRGRGIPSQPVILGTPRVSPPPTVTHITHFHWWFKWERGYV